jgi:hypothetical protein
MIGTSSRIVLLSLVCLQGAIAGAADNQTWSVKIVGDTAILRAAPKTELKFVRSTLDELQAAGFRD